MGYLMPVVASMFIVWKYPEAFGGGDIKLLCAIGAWVGPEIIAYIILGACIIFALSCLVNLSAMPATQGLYGFVAFLLWPKDSAVMAESGFLYFAVGLAAGMVFLFSAIRQGQVCANGIIGISQGHDVQTNTMIYAALPEFYAILALVASLMI